MNDTTIGGITNGIAVLGLLSLAYGKFIGARQNKVVEAIIQGLQVKSRYRPAVNFGTGVVIATLLSVFLAVWLGNWEVLVIGVVAGIFASEEAADVHDTERNQSATLLSSKTTNGTTTTTTTAAKVPVELAVDDK